MSHERLVPAYLLGERSGVVVFACGDPRHGDDSVAVLACRSLPAEALAMADVKLIGPLRAEYLRDLPNGIRAVIVDGVLGATPGDIVTMDLIEMSGREEPIQARSAGDLPLDQVVAVAQLLRDEPVIGRFVGIGVDAPAERVDSQDEVAESPATPKHLVEALRDAVARAVAELGKGGSGASL